MLIGDTWPLFYKRLLITPYRCIARLFFSLKSGFSANQALIVVVAHETCFRHLKFLWGSLHSSLNTSLSFYSYYLAGSQGSTRTAFLGRPEVQTDERPYSQERIKLHETWFRRHLGIEDKHFHPESVMLIFCSRLLRHLKMCFSWWLGIPQSWQWSWISGRKLFRIQEQDVPPHSEELATPAPCKKGVTDTPYPPLLFMLF